MEQPSTEDSRSAPSPPAARPSLPPLTPDLLPDSLGGREITRIVALEAHVSLLEQELSKAQADLAHIEFKQRTTERELRRERTWNRQLRTEFKRLVRWLDQIQDQVARLYSTRRWKTANLLRKAAGFAGLDAILARHSEWKRHRPSGTGLDGRVNSYAIWLAEKRPGLQKRQANSARIQHMAVKPCFGLVMALDGNIGAAELASSVASLDAQTYADWRLYALQDDVQAPMGLTGHPRITVCAAGQLPGGVTHLAGINPGDTLEPHALESIALALDDRSLPADLIYTDEDEIDAFGALGNPFLKPAWSPDTLESCHYTGALAVYRRQFLERLGLGAGALAPGRSYGTVLLAAEVPDFRASRIPSVLHHRRRLDDESRVRLAGQDLDSLRRALERRQCPAEVRHGEQPGLFHVRRQIRVEEKTTIFIPTRDGLNLLRRCLDSLQRTTFTNYEVVIINNGSRDPGTLEFLAASGHRIFDFPGPFNYAAMHNAAVAATSSPWLLFLNNDTEIIGPGWLHAMAEHVQRPEIAAVGAKLLFPDGTVQHAGVVLGIHQRAAHAFAGINPASLTGHGQLQMLRNYSAVTAACMMMRRDVYERLGGFDAERFPVAYNDVELCIRALRYGYRNVCTPHAVLKHHECATRPRRDNLREVQNLHQTCFGPPGWSDPFYHPLLNHDQADFSPAGL